MAHTPGTTPVAGGPTRGQTGSGGRGVATGFRGRLLGWLDRIVPAFMVIALGVLLGQQYMQPDKRIVSVIAVVVLAGGYRLDGLRTFDLFPLTEHVELVAVLDLA